MYKPDMIKLNFSSLNCNSLVARGRLEELETVLEERKIDVCHLQETFYKEKHTPNMINFNLYRTDRIGIRGGTAIAVRKNIDAQVVPIKDLARLDFLEATAVMINLGQDIKLFCISIYNANGDRRFGGDLMRIFEVLRLEHHDHQYVIGGDFNALHTDWGCQRTYPRGNEMRAFINRNFLRFDCRLLASVSPSRPTSGSYPDLVIVKGSVDLGSIGAGVINGLGVVNITFSDHIMMVWECGFQDDGEGVQAPLSAGRLGDLRKGVPYIKKDQFWGLLFANCGKYGFSVDEVDDLAGKTLKWDDLNEVTESFTRLIIDAMEGCIKPRRQKKTLFVPAHIRDLVQEKRRITRYLFDCYRLGRRDDPRVQSRIAGIKHEIENASWAIKRAWNDLDWQKEMAKLDRIQSSETKDFFRVLDSNFQYKAKAGFENESFEFERTARNELKMRGTNPIVLNNGNCLITGNDVTQVLGNVLEDTFNPEGCGILGDAEYEEKTAFTEKRKSTWHIDDRFMTRDDLDGIIKRMNGKHSSGPDGIPNSVIKMLPVHFRSILLIILNNSINLNKLPKIWKLSAVVFIKKDMKETKQVDNYRPISLLCNFSKILETFYLGKLELEIEDKNLISKNQFGFRRGLGTVHAISSLINDIQRHKLENRIVAVIFVDLKKAFDSVDHQLLINRMRALKIEKGIVDFFENFLAGRNFISKKALGSVVDVSDLHDLDRHRVGRGVLQGSISGPVLFTLFINDVLDRIGGSIAYADDLCILDAYEDVRDLNLRLEGRFQRLQLMMEQRKLSINYEKTKVMLFRQDNHEYTVQNNQLMRDFCISARGIDLENGEFIEGQQLEMVESFKYLGVVLDKFLKFDSHIEMIRERTRNAHYATKKILQLEGLDDHKKIRVYKTVIRPLITYACPTWTLITPTLMTELSTLEYKIIRNLFGRYRRRNGHYVSYRSLLVRAKMPGVIYNIIKITKRHLLRLNGKACATVKQDTPDWIKSLRFIKKGYFTPESLMFVEALGLLQDEFRRNIFYSLDRHALASSFDLIKMLRPEAVTRRCRYPTVHEYRESIIEVPWECWVCPPHLLIRHPTL